jgi:hypothetical protein
MDHERPHAVMYPARILKSCHTKLKGNFTLTSGLAFLSKGKASALIRFIDVTPIIQTGPLMLDLYLFDIF